MRIYAQEIRVNRPSDNVRPAGGGTRGDKNNTAEQESEHSLQTEPGSQQKQNHSVEKDAQASPFNKRDVKGKVYNSPAKSEAGKNKCSAGQKTDYQSKGNFCKPHTRLKNRHKNGHRAAHRRQRRHKKYEGPIYGALDLGTNNCRLLVARPTRRGFVVIDAFSRIIRLGEGVTRSGRLSQAAIDRTIDALKICSDKMLRRGVIKSRLVATEACRIAHNSKDFVTQAQHETGLSLEIVSRETEAKLAVSGCASLLDRKCDFALVFDIGGGSSEIIWLDLNRRKRRWRRSLYDRLEAQDCIMAWTSLPVGVVTLSEKFGGQYIDGKIFEQMVEYVLSMLVDFEKTHQINKELNGSTAHLLGTSGTVTTVAGVHLGLQCYDRNRVDGCWLDIGAARKVTDTIVGMSHNQRIAEPCIGAERADLVLAGCAILEALMRMWPCTRLRVADRGLREGILATLMAEDGLLRGNSVPAEKPDLSS